MKSHEFIQAAADMLAAMGGTAQQTTEPQQANRAVLTPAEPEHNEGDDVNTQSMVAPLQQKLELLKKAVDVDNMYDNPERAGGEEESGSIGGDEVDDMKRLAGIMVLGGDDEPFEA